MHPETLKTGPRPDSPGTGAHDSAPESGAGSLPRAEAGGTAVACGSARKEQHGAEAAPSPDARIPPHGPDVYETKASAAWKALNERYRSSLAQAEIDHLHARFVLGLTQPSFGEGPPAAHLEALRRLLARNLPPERVEAALNDIPPPGEAWVEEAFERIESQGERIGRGISNGDEGSAAGEDGAAGR